MIITLEVPDRIARQTGQTVEEVKRVLLESFAAEGYRQELLSHGDVQELLAFSWQEAEAFLHRRGAYLHYDLSDLEQDRRAMEMLGKQ